MALLSLLLSVQKIYWLKLAGYCPWTILFKEELVGCSFNFDFQQTLLGHIFVHDCTKNLYLVKSCHKSWMVHSIPKIEHGINNLRMTTLYPQLSFLKNCERLSVRNQTWILYTLLLYQQQKFGKVRRKISIEKLDLFEVSRAEKLRICCLGVKVYLNIQQKCHISSFYRLHNLYNQDSDDK